MRPVLPKGRQLCFTWRERAEVRDPQVTGLRVEGLRHKEIALKLGITRRWSEKVATRSGAGVVWRAVRDGRIRQLRAQGVSVRKTAEAVGCAPNTVQKVWHGR